MDIFLATGNAHKPRNSAACSPKPASRPRPVRQELGGMPYVDEYTGTFTGNCRLKAEALQRIAPPKSWILALTVASAATHLQGGPGVDSAVYAGPKATDAENRVKLLEAMKKAPRTNAARASNATCSSSDPNGVDMKFVGQCWGRILEAEVGTEGFGYDRSSSLAASTRPSENSNHRPRTSSATALKPSPNWLSDEGLIARVLKW
ncbi:non-canonical purine NTP pyrophosphatase [Verrucomicrobiota bacterium]|nr:non-canonical purine NTP pyrophosphatase [Verrucomicrobiota bacterium]